MPTDSTAILPDPMLLGPSREQQLRASEVTLRWEPVEGAEQYLVQVARDTSFADVAFGRETGETSLALGADVPADGNTYFWRVIARVGTRSSAGERIESFMPLDDATFAASPEVEPDGKESLGPVVELFKAAGAEAASEVTGSRASAEAEADLGVEHEGVESGQIIGLVVAVVIALAVIIVFVFTWTDIVYQESSTAVVNVSGYPDLRETELNARRALDNYEAVPNGFRIPIDQAMSAIANEQTLQADSGQTAPAGVTTSELPDLSGR